MPPAHRICTRTVVPKLAPGFVLLLLLAGLLGAWHVVKP